MSEDKEMRFSDISSATENRFCTSKISMLYDYREQYLQQNQVSAPQPLICTKNLAQRKIQRAVSVPKAITCVRTRAVVCHRGACLEQVLHPAADILVRFSYPAAEAYNTTFSDPEDVI